MMTEEEIAQTLDPKTSPEKLWEIAVSSREEEKVDLLLKSFPAAKKILVIKALRQLSGFGLKSTKTLCEAAPIFLNRKGISRKEAEDWKSVLAASGATVEVLPRYGFHTKGARLVAKNPGTPRELLSVLSRSDDAEIRKALVRNPGVPLSVLSILGLDFPQDFLQNPLFPLLRVETPKIVQKLPRALLKSLLSVSDISEVWIKESLEHKDIHVRLAAAFHKKAPPNALVALCESEKDSWLLSRIAAHPSLPVALLIKLSKHNSIRVRASVAANQNTPVSLLEDFALLDSVDILEGLAQNPNIPVSIVPRLARLSEYRIEDALSKNPGLSAEVLAQLAQDEEESCHMIASIHTNTPPSYLAIFSQSKTYRIQERAFKNPNMPLAVIEWFLSSPNTNHRYLAACSPKLSKTQLLQLANDAEESVRMAVAMHENIPQKSLKKLLYDPSSMVRRGLAANKSLTEEFLKILLKDEEKDVRVAMTYNPNTSYEIFQNLREDPAEEVQKALHWSRRGPDWIVSFEK